MSVVSSGKFIFCEGKKNSLDYQLLNQIVTNIVTIAPSGGKFSFSTFIDGYFSSTNIDNKKYLVFRDRDFDAEPTSDIQLIQLRRNIWLTHRACIENYLLNADLIHSYWQEKYQEKQNNPTSKWGHGNSPGIEIISEWIESAARNLKEYQTVRWSLANLLLDSATRIQLKTTWTGGSGQLPKSLDLSDCKNEAIELIKQFRKAVDRVTQERFEESLEKYQEQFAQEEFWEQKQYLIWFHGKDIQKEMQRQKSQYISLNNFVNWAVVNIDIYRYPDLRELQIKIEQL